MILRRPENGAVPTTTIRLPWQQARVQIKVLSDDVDNLFAMYTLKHCKESWENWTTQNDLTHKSLEDALDEIARISSKIDNNNNNNNTNSNLLFNKFDFLEIRQTQIYKKVEKHLTTNLHHKRNLRNIENVLKVILSLIKVQNTKESPKRNCEATTRKDKDKVDLNRSPEYEEDKEYSDNCKGNSRTIAHGMEVEQMEFYCHDNKNSTDKIACILSTWLIFWPYSVSMETLYEDSLLETVSRDRDLFSESRATSITEHIQFAMKAIEHLGHEVVYKK